MSINNLFLSATLFVLLFVVFGDERGTYLEHAQVPLYGLIFTEMVLIFLNKRLKNPLLDIVNLVFIVFFILRVPFFYGDGLISDLYIRNVSIDMVSYALYILNFQLIVLSACVLLVNPVRIYAKKITIADHQLNRILNCTFIILLINLLNLMTFFKLGADNISNTFAILLALLNYSSVLLLIVPVIFFIDKNLEVKYRIYLFLQFITVVTIVMYSGSKSGLLQVLEVWIVFILATHGASHRLSPKTLLTLLLILCLAFPMFFLGDIFNKIQRLQAVMDDVPDLFAEAIGNLYVALNSISYRMGYLDFYIDKLVTQEYASSFDIENYIKAFLNAVSPGFDFFDNAPLVSRAVYNNYFGQHNSPNSEAITAFAEAHQLFSYFSFVAYLFVLGTILIVRKFMFKPISAYGEAIRRMFLCLIFYRYMMGFGIDYWLFGDVIYSIIFVTFSIKYIEYSTKYKLKY